MTPSSRLGYIHQLSAAEYRTRSFFNETLRETEEVFPRSRRDRGGASKGQPARAIRRAATGSALPFQIERHHLALLLLIQDGLPILGRSATRTTEGVLMAFNDESAIGAYKTIDDFEPDSIYAWDSVEVAGSAPTRFTRSTQKGVSSRLAGMGRVGRPTIQ